MEKRRDEKAMKKYFEDQDKCPPGMEYVTGFKKEGGTYVKGFCRKVN